MEVNLATKNYLRLEHNNLDHRNYVVVNWCIGSVCNYSCSYCPEALHDGKMKFPQGEEVIKFIDRTISHYSGKKIYFEFTGGEVTLWKDLISVATYLRQRDCRVGIISNGSRSLEFYEKLIPLIDHICLSFHPESAKEDHFLSVVKLSADQIRTHVNLMMKPDLFDKSLSVALKVKNIPNISIALQPLMENLNGAMLAYNETQTKIMNNQHELLVKHIKYTKSYEYYRGAMAMITNEAERKPIASQRFISSATNSWKDWHCYAGLEQIVVDMFGTIYRGWCLAGGRIGSIFDETLLLPEKPIKCQVEKCHCNLDIMTTKVKCLVE